MAVMSIQDAWVTRLVAWFEAAHRPMPWRTRPTRYRVWISEIMLQQTQVATVVPYFSRFIARYPTVRKLAAANPSAVLQLWEGLGYYTRARNLHKAAGIVVRERGGALPATFADWLALPGIGRYTAAAIASIADGEAVPAVDGNVLRVFARFWGCRDDVARPATRDRFFARLQPIVATAPPALFNQAVMEVGALLCKPRRPACDICPLAADCTAHRDTLTTQLPTRTRAARGPHYHTGVALLRRRDRILLARRPTDGLLGGLWELPNARRIGREALRVTARRAADQACRMAPAVTSGGTRNPVDAGAEQARITHAFSHFSETLHVYEMTSPPGARAARGTRWASPAMRRNLPCTTATRKLLAALAAEPAPRSVALHATNRPN